MKKTLAVLLTVGLLAALIVAPADAGPRKRKKKKPTPAVVLREVEIAYSSPGIGVTVLGRGGGYPVNFPDSVDIPVMPEEKYMKIEVTDASGQAVAGYISQGDVNGDGLNNDLYGDFCGAHEEAIELAVPGNPIVGIYAYNGTCPDGTPSIMTEGTIKITFSPQPF